MSFHLRRPSGIRNGGLLLVLVALAAVMALVDKPPQAGDGRRLPGAYLHLPPPAGITALPPVLDQPPTPALRFLQARRPDRFAIESWAGRCALR